MSGGLLDDLLATFPGDLDLLRRLTFQSDRRPLLNVEVLQIFDEPPVNDTKDV